MQSTTEVNQAINMMFRSADLMLNVPKTFTDVVKSVVDDKVTPNSIIKATNRELNKEIDAGHTDCIFTDPDPGKLQEIKKKMQQNDIFCETGIYKGKGVIITLSSQREMAQMTLNKYFAEKDFKFASAEELNSTANGNVCSFSVDSEEKAVMIQKRCEQNDIRTNIVQGNKEFIIRYAEADSSIMNQIKQDVAIDFLGAGGEIIKGQLAWENKNTCDIINSVINDDYEKGSIIADREGNYLVVNKFDIEVHKNDEQMQRIKRSDKEFAALVNTSICEMDRPIYLKNDQFKEIQGLNGIKREEKMLDIEREQGRPTLSQEDIYILEKREQERVLINQKLNQDHPDEVRNELNDYNSNQPLICFKEAEKSNFEAAHDISEAGFEDATILDNARAAYEGMNNIEDSISLTDELEMEEQLNRSMGDIDNDIDEVANDIDTIEVEAELD